MKNKRWLTITLLVILSMMLVACGGGDDPEPTAEETTQEEAESSAEESAEEADPVTLTVLVHQNPPMVEFMETFNADFEAANPNVTVDMSVVNASDLSTVTQTRLTAEDIDVIDIFGFANPVQDYMGDATPPSWQTLIEAGLLLDITDQPFIDNYDEPTIQDAGSYNGRVYSINLGRVTYSGMFVNTDLLAENGLDVPTTWSELVSSCETITEAGLNCMTVGGGDGWPVFVGSYGLLGSMFPDQEALVEGLWTGNVKWNDAETLDLWERYQVYTQELLEDGVTGISHDAGPARFSAGDVAYMPTGNWQGPALEEAAPAFEWTYIPFPGSDNPEDNQYLFGKYDQGWAIAADSPNQETALAYLAAFSEPDNYQAFIDAVGFIPTQPTATLDSQLGQAVAPYLDSFRVGFEQFWVEPQGAGQWANGSQGASWFVPFNEWEDAAALADQSQADLQAALDANQ